MATSIYEGRLLTGRTWDANAAADARHVRDIVQNNALHWADESGQVLVNFVQTSLSFDAGGGGFAENPVEYNEWRHVVSFGPFPVRLRQNGDTYRFRIRVAGSTPNEGNGKIRVVVCPQTEASGAVQLSTDYVFETATLGADDPTPRWLTGASLGSNAWTTMIYAPASVTSDWLTTTSTLTNVSGNAVSVEQCLVSFNVFTYTTTSTASDEPGVSLDGLYIAEYIGT